jgi:hypothetical protein
MADKNLGITVTGDISDVSEAISNLIELIQSIPDKAIEINANIDDLLIDINDLSNTLMEIPGEAEEVSESLNKIDGANIQEASDAAGSLSENLSGASDDAQEAGAGLDNAAESTDGVSAAAGVAGLGITAMIGGMINGAGNIQDQYRRIGGVMGTSAAQTEALWGATASKMAEATGRGAGQAREFIIKMGTAGITNSQLIADGFKMISGAAFLTGNSVESIQTAYQRVLMSGTLGSRQLMQLGINSSDVMKATGMTVEELNVKMKGMSQEQRAALLNSIMNLKDGTVANEAYKSSWQHSLDAMERAGQYALRVLGALVLPTAKWAVDGVTGAINNLVAWMDKLQGPTGDLIKGFLAAGLILAGFIGVLTGIIAAMRLLQIWSALVTIWTYALRLAHALAAAASGDFAGALGILRGAKAADAVATEGQVAAENTSIFSKIRSGGASLLLAAQTAYSTAAMWAHILAVEAYTFLTSGTVLATVGAIASRTALTVVTGIATAAQWAWNAAMMANPIGLVVLAIAALIGALIYVFTQTEWGRKVIASLWNYLSGLVGFLKGIDMNKIWEWLWKGLKFAFDMVFLPFTLGRIFIEEIIKWLTGGAGADKIWDWIYTGVKDAFDKVYAFFYGLTKYLIELPGNMYKWGADIILGLINGIVDAIPGLRQALSAIGINFPQSPPKEGPLSKITPEGFRDWGMSLVGGLSSGMNSAQKFMDDTLSGISAGISPANLSLNAPSLAAINSSSAGTKNEIHITVDLSGLPSDTPPDKAREIGRNVGEGAADELHQQMTTKGYSAYNRSR